jgi:hypothetical protein
VCYAENLTLTMSLDDLKSVSTGSICLEEDKRPEPVREFFSKSAAKSVAKYAASQAKKAQDAQDAADLRAGQKQWLESCQRRGW